jgi:hypothetical protein
MKLSPITRADLLLAADEFDHSGEQPWTEYWLYITEKDKEYPFKPLVRRAYELSTGKEVDSDFFQSNDGYRSYITEKFSYPIIFRVRENIPFFTEADLEFFAAHAGQPYRKDDAENKKVGEIIKKTIISKTNTWARALNIGDFEVKLDNTWQRSGYFAGWSWARIYRSRDRDMKVFFTVGVDAEEQALIYKLHCYFRSRNPENALTDQQQRIFDRIVNSTGAGWQQIGADELADYDWQSLIELTREFIERYIPLYDEVISAVWSRSAIATDEQNILVERPVPPGIGQAPARKQVIFSANADYDEENKHRKRIGDKGENLVILWEQAYLRRQGRADLAGGVGRVLDSQGFDIHSYHPDGRSKFIEVKTTVGPHERPFYWTWNERETMLKNPGSYCLYRLYNYDEKLNSAEFYRLEGDISDKIILEPEHYRVFIK